MTKEFAALKNNKTWTLVPHPKDRDVIQCKWIFKIKKNVDGSISRYKARLVAKGFTQIAGLDYTETYSPVVKPTTVRIILSLAISNSWTMRQLDIDNAFLNGELTEELYMSQVPGFEEYDNTGAQLVCKLKKSLYGLKQASRAWNSKLSSVLCNLGFKSSAADSSLYYRRNGDCNIFILTYVDDIIITGSSSVEINTVIDSLSKNFPLKDLGQLHYFLGIEISQTSSGAFLNQSSYITEILKQTNMIEAKPVASPMVINHQLSKINGKPMENGTNYRKVIGALQYATISRPDISFSVNKLSQYMQNPLDNHWKALKRVLRYLAGSIDFGLHFYSDSSLHLSGFADADWGSDVDDRRSTSGYCVFMGKNLVSWSSKKQGIVSRSSSEAEYRSVAAVTCELVWIQNLLSELGIKVPKPSIIWNDNTSAVSLSSNPVFHSRTKHLELDLHFIRDKIKEGIVSVRYVPGLHQVADILTKPLTGQFFARFRNKLNITSKRAIELRGAEKSTLHYGQGRASICQHEGAIHRA